MLPIKTLWQPRVYVSTKDAVGPSEVTVTFINLSDSIKAMLQPLQSCQDSVIFQRLWLQHANSVKQQMREETRGRGGAVLSLEDIAEKVWPPAKHGWDTLCTQLRNGSITFGTLDIYFEDFKNK